jgi:cytidine diphosphoramidate kinase
MAIWITGLSGAGKTSLSEALVRLLKPSLPELLVLDGDAIRALYGRDLGHCEESRRVQIGRLQHLAQFLSGQGQIVLVAALYSHPDLLAENRRTLPNYFEIYIDAPLSLLRERDSKGLYAAALAGHVSNVVGVDIPWHPPLQPDLRIDAAKAASPSELALQVANRIPRLREALAGELA